VKNRLTSLTRTKTWDELLSFSYDTLLDNGLPSLTFSQVTNSTDVTSNHLHSFCKTLDINLCQYALRVESLVAVKPIAHGSIPAPLPSLILRYKKLLYGVLAKHFQIWACV
jgi:hypothetical protein